DPGAEGSRGEKAQHRPRRRGGRRFTGRVRRRHARRVGAVGRNHQSGQHSRRGMNVPIERVREQIVTLLTAWGMDPELVRIAAEVMVETDLAGVDSHGVSMLMDYENSKSKGKLNLQARPRVVRESPTTALVDADAGLGHPAAVMAMGIAIKKAKAMGVGVVSVFNSHHFGAAGYYAAMASKEGLVGMVTSATRSIAVVPTRAAVPVLGTNPIAFAAPARRNAPFLLDIATSTVANNKIKLYELNG